MATLLDLQARDQLFKLDPSLDPSEQEWRMIYTSPQLRAWIEDDLDGLISTWKLEASPSQQLDALVEEFCSGVTLYYGQQFKPIQHVKGGIWELKTPDLRMFGWFYVKDCFIAWKAEHADYVKKSGAARRATG